MLRGFIFDSIGFGSGCMVIGFCVNLDCVYFCVSIFLVTEDVRKVRSVRDSLWFLFVLVSGVVGQNDGGVVLGLTFGCMGSI